jgi:hypothetical protein
VTTWLAPIVGGFVLISDEDRPLLRHKWRVIRPDGVKPYAAATIDSRTVYLHRLVMGAQRGQEVDHINGDGLDNSRENLRLATRSQNCANRAGYKPKSGFRGVYQHSNGEGWQVKLTVNGRHIRGGSYRCVNEAARAYDDLARQHFGEFAILNFPEQETV